MLQFKRYDEDLPRLTVHPGGRVRVQLAGIRPKAPISVTSADEGSVTVASVSARDIAGQARVVLQITERPRFGAIRVTARVGGPSADTIPRSTAPAPPGVPGAPPPRGGPTTAGRLGGGESGAPSAVAVQDVDVLEVVVERMPEFPDPSTDAGALARMFVAEVYGPANGDYDHDVAVQTMQWMRLVFHNRLKAPKYFRAEGARTMIEMIKAPGQVKGFGDYPTIAPPQAKHIEAILAIAKDDSDRRQPKYLAFFRAAIEVATGPMPKDPTRLGLFGWRTAGKGDGNTPGYVDYKTLGQNTFFTVSQEWYDGIRGLGKPAR